MNQYISVVNSQPLGEIQGVCCSMVYYELAGLLYISPLGKYNVTKLVISTEVELLSWYYHRALLISVFYE